MDLTRGALVTISDLAEKIVQVHTYTYIMNVWQILGESTKGYLYCYSSEIGSCIHF